MCGIAGILNLSEGPAPAEWVLRTMLGTIRHRGPDQFGLYLAPRVALGSARLSIVDLGGGQQPISNEDGRYWIVFNGEIFNHPELRAELEARGHQFATHCDTEAIVHLYEDLGPACLNRLNGQFSLAIWDARDQTLFLARDRVGVRPLFYAQTPGSLIFGSEIKAILAVPGFRPEPDPVAIEQVFTYWSPQSPRTCFQGVRELPPGHYLVVRDGALEIQSYWELSFASPPRKGEASLEDYVEELGDLLVDAARIRLRADVPVGAYLSGGLDSSLIAAIVRRLGVGHLDTFSISFSDPRFDESPYQRKMAEFLGTDHQVLYTTQEDIGRAFPEVIWHTETPLVRTAPAPLFLLSNRVRDCRYKVVLTGEGADEFLAGYDLFKEAKIRRFWARQPASRWRPSLLRRLYPDIQSLSSTGGSYLAAFFGVGLKDVDDPGYSHAIRWRNSRRNCRFFSEDLRQSLATAGEGRSGPEVPSQFRHWHPLEQAQYLEITSFLSPYLLASQGDRVAMAHSVEGRFPFLDVRVMEFCNRLPPRYKLRGLTEKFLLRRVAQRWLPAEISARGKRPYRAPIHRCFIHERSPEYVSELLSPESLRSAGFFQPAAVAQLTAKAREGRAFGEADEMALVGILSTQLWHHRFFSCYRSSDPLGEGDDVKVVHGAPAGGSRGT